MIVSLPRVVQDFRLGLPKVARSRCFDEMRCDKRFLAALCYRNHSVTNHTLESSDSVAPCRARLVWIVEKIPFNGICMAETRQA